MFADFFAALWGIVVDTAPYMLIGVLLSGLLHQSIARWSWLQKIIRGRNPVSLLFCNLLGLSMPLCSCGVVPMAVGLRRGHNIPLGNTFAFLFSAPVTSLTALVLFAAVFGLRFTAFYLLGGLVCGFAIGLVFYLVERKPEFAALVPGASCGPLVEPPLTGGFLQRSLKWGLGIYGSRIAFDQIIGLSLCAFALVLVPLTDISAWLNQAPYLLAALLLVLVALPLFVCSIPAILLAGAMVLNGLKPELAWVFLMAGPITNLGDINVMRRQFGRIPVAIYMAAVLVVVVLWGLVIKNNVHLSTIFDHVYAFFDSTVVQIDMCGTDFVQQSQGLWELLSTNWWPMVSIFSAPFYVALIANGAYHAWREYYLYPCMYCAHYQKEVHANLGKCDTPCWKLKLQERLVRVFAACRLPSPSPSPHAASKSLRIMVLPSLLMGLALVALNLYQLSTPPQGQAETTAATEDAKPVTGSDKWPVYKPYPEIKPTPLQGIEGYTRRFSLPPDEDVKIFFAGSPVFQGQCVLGIEVYNAVNDKLVYKQNIEPRTLMVPVAKCKSYMDKGCDFTGTFTIPGRVAQPGVYKVKLKTSLPRQQDHVYGIFYNIRSRSIQPGQIVLVFPTFTLQAYNKIGGASFYTRHSFKLNPRVVSFLRPLPRNVMFGHRVTGLLTVVKAVAKYGYDYVTIGDNDLHTSPEIISQAALVMLMVHEEYMSWEMRQAIHKYVLAGGKLLVAGGNTCWFKVRVEGDNMILYFRKTDPVRDPKHRTGYWHYKLARPWPAEATFGLTYLHHGYPIHRNYKKFEDLPPEAGLTRSQYEAARGMTVVNPNHPIFSGTGLIQGQVLGAHLPLNDVESDGLLMTGNGQPDYKRMPFAPRGIVPLAVGCGIKSRLKTVITMAEVPLGKGVVLNLGTMGWSRVFQKNDPVCKRIFKNSIDYLLAR